MASSTESGEPPGDNRSIGATPSYGRKLLQTLVGYLVTTMIIAAGVVALLTFARDQEWWPYHADTHIELTAPDTNITIGDSDLAVYIRGTLPDPQEHIWVVATDERNRWYPLTEAFRDARNGRWSSVIRPTELGAPAGTHLALHAVIADSAASNALYAAVGNPQTSKVGLDHLPTGANSVDHVEVVR